MEYDVFSYETSLFLIEEMNKVAVIMSVYRSDSLEFLKEAVNSILTQIYENTSLFIYRDGAVSQEIDDYLKFIDNEYINITLIISDCNLGLPHALNSLIDIVLSDGTFSYIARMDSDDISRANRLKKQIDFFECNSDVDVCGTSCREFGASFAIEEKHLPELHAELLNFSITHCPFIHPSVMFRVDVFTTGIRYPTDTSLTEDMALWFVLLNQGIRFSNLNEILIDYRLNENTIKRRSGWKKGWSEFTIRFENMILLKRINVKNVILITSRLVFHILPNSIMKIAYRKIR